MNQDRLCGAGLSKDGPRLQGAAKSFDTRRRFAGKRLRKPRAAIGRRLSEKFAHERDEGGLGDVRFRGAAAETSQIHSHLVGCRRSHARVAGDEAAV